MRESLPNWAFRPLGELTDKIGSGATPRGGQSTYQKNGVSLIRSLNVHDLHFRYGDLARIDDEQATALSNVEVEARDVLLNITGASIARCAQVPLDVLPARVNQHVSILRPKIGLLDSRFLSYLLVSDDTKNRLLNIGDKAGATRQALTKAQLQTFVIPVPPLKEQKRIVAVLDQALAAIDRVRALVEANLVDAHSLFESELQASFERLADGRDQVPFERLCDAITPRVKIKRQDYLEVGAYPIVSQEASLVSGYWNDSAALLGLNDPVVVFGDHTCCLKYVDFDFVVGADGTKVLKPRAGVLAAYLYFGLRSQPIAESGYARHFKLLRGRSLPDIPLDQQKALADRLFGLEEKCDDMARVYEAKLAALAALRQSLLQKAFSGQLA